MSTPPDLRNTINGIVLYVSGDYVDSSVHCSNQHNQVPANVAAFERMGSFTA